MLTFLCQFFLSCKFHKWGIMNINIPCNNLFAFLPSRRIMHGFSTYTKYWHVVVEKLLESITHDALKKLRLCIWKWCSLECVLFYSTKIEYLCILTALKQLHCLLKLFLVEVEGCQIKRNLQPKKYNCKFSDNRNIAITKDANLGPWKKGLSKRTSYSLMFSSIL